MPGSLEDFFLAVAEHVTTFDPADFTRLTAVLPAARQVVHAPTWFSLDAAAEPVSVFDVLPPAPEL